MTWADTPEPGPGTWLLNKLDAREQALTGQIEQTQTEIDTLTARLSQLGEAVEHLRISRKRCWPWPPTSRPSPPRRLPPCPITWPTGRSWQPSPAWTESSSRG